MRNQTNKPENQSPVLLQVQVRNVFGTERIYPINDTAKQFALLLKRPTLTKNDLGILKGVGIKIEFMPQHINLAAE